MKTLKLFIVLIPLLVFFACEGEENGQAEINGEQKEEVEKYVNALKKNQYDDNNLPAFTDKHVDELLKYRNDENVITKFSRNPLSSFYQEECELGIYILWTIEYIRIKSINSDLLIVGKFPSMNPIFRLRDSEELEFVSDTEAHQIVSNAYYTWWTSNKDKTLIEIMEIDPLRHTIYKWH